MADERMRLVMLLKLLAEMLGPEEEEEDEAEEELPEHWQPVVKEPSVRVRPDFFPMP